MSDKERVAAEELEGWAKHYMLLVGNEEPDEFVKRMFRATNTIRALETELKEAREQRDALKAKLIKLGDSALVAKKSGWDDAVAYYKPDALKAEVQRLKNALIDAEEWVDENIPENTLRVIRKALRGEGGRY